MAFKYLTNIPREQAQKEYMQALQAQGWKEYTASATETVAVQDAVGRKTAHAVYAHISAPHYPASAMDGIAVMARDSYGATETTPVTLPADKYIVVDTGDPVPENCDAVIMVEDISRQDDGSVKIYAASTPWQHVRQIGEDICAGEMILPSMVEITPASVGAMLAGGVLEVEVIRRPRVGIIPTGDEIVPPTADPQPGDIIEFNSSIFSGMLRQWGAEPVVYPIVPDVAAKIEETLRRAVKECDMVMLNAGSSAGREDFSTEIIDKVGTVLYHGIAIKPGKPAILGYSGCKPILGVPGYPVSGILVAELFMKPFVDAWFGGGFSPLATRDSAKDGDFSPRNSGDTTVDIGATGGCFSPLATDTAANDSATGGNYSPRNSGDIVRGVLSRAIVSSLKYEEFVRVRLGRVGDKLMVSPLNRGAGVVSSFMKADGIVTIPQDSEGFEAGSEVEVRLLRPAADLDNILVAIGSHDPLLDELADLIHCADAAVYMNSTHVGSMGGIMATKRGETHIAGVHLLDEKDGSYNSSFVRKYLRSGGARLVECVGRTQGLMLQKGNPLGITGIADLTRDGVRYVNRQKGSGTRVLMDYLCAKENVDCSKIYGYDREEFTHNSVATQIVNNTADAGMGIYSAAHTYGLDFLPICVEQYDLLITDEAWETPQVQLLIRLLETDEFRTRLEKLGGYVIDQPGRVREHF